LTGKKEGYKLAESLTMNKFLCAVFGHHYGLSRSIRHIKEYDCVHCGKQVTSIDGRKIYPLTPEIKNINQAVEAFYNKSSSTVNSSSSTKSVA
jgi:hypothetical protein